MVVYKLKGGGGPEGGSKNRSLGRTRFQDMRNDKISIKSEPGKELVQLSLEDSVGDKLALFRHLCRHSYF